MEVRICRDCGVGKPLSEYYPKGNKSHKITSRCRQCHSARQHAKHLEDLRNGKEKIRKDRKKQFKPLVLAHYGPNGSNGVAQCSWPGCCVTDLDMLSIDHVNDDGAEHRRKKSAPGQRCWGGATMYAELYRNGFGGAYQTLCMNHQFKKKAIKLQVDLHNKIAHD